MPNVALAPIWVASQFLDNNGFPLNGGYIKSFFAGSFSVPQSTYSDSSGTTPNPIQINLNSAGRLTVPIWLVIGAKYNLVLYAANGTILDNCDNVVGIGSITSSDPLTTNGDLYTYNGGPARLPIGSNGQVLTVSGGFATWQPGATGGFSVNAQTGTTYTTVLSDSNNVVTMNNSASNTLILAPSLYAVGTIVSFVQLGAGTTTIAGGSGVTVHGSIGVSTRTQYSMGTALLVSANNWVLSGDLQ